jgi:hypothetical protein
VALVVAAKAVAEQQPHLEMDKAGSPDLQIPAVAVVVVLTIFHLFLKRAEQAAAVL